MKRGREFEEGGPIDKTQVLQDAKQHFMATAVKTKKLVDVLTKCIYIILQGERLSNIEATDLFFHMTRLFQYKDKDNTLRRLTYIGIKALSQQAENVYVVTSSLTTDVNSSRDDPAVRASALRALCQISDASTFTTIERYLKQSVVDKHPVVASAALTSLIRIAQINPEIVRRCTNEIQNALQSDSPMVQYHALALRYISMKNDRLATLRLMSSCVNLGLKSPLAICLLLRIIANYINESPNSDETKGYIPYIRDCLNHRCDAVEYEAANTIVSINQNKDASKLHRKCIPAAVSHLRNFLSASKVALKFAAVRSLNRLANVAPSEVRECNLDLEHLISQPDCNRSIAILAITTLLKTGTESNVDRFLKQIGEFLSEIDDGFKVVVVGSVRQLCQKYPSKHVAMMDFLSNMLREEGGYSYKKAIVDTIINIIEDNEQTKEKGLEQLCEFIEDCEHNDLAIEILDLLGREGPKTKRPATYIRFIANRLLLDASPVACAAITALAKFGTIPELSESIKTALERFSLHEDFDVMERAIFYKNILNSQDHYLEEKFIKSTVLDVSFEDLEAKLMNYLETDCEEPFDISKVRKTLNVKDNSLNQMHISSRDDDMEDEPEATKNDAIMSTKSSNIDAGLRPPMNIFDDIDLGELIKSTKSMALTDSVSEFGVKCIKHVYHKHIVFQFDCTNTVDSLCLENVTIELDPPPGFDVLATTVYPKLAYNETVPIYSCVELIDEACCEINYFTNVNLKYNYRNVNPDTREVEDDVNEDVFPLEDMLIDLTKVLTADHIESLGWIVDQE